MILDKFRLDGRVAVVTGGSRGLGRAMAQGLAEAGADVAVVARSENPEVGKYIAGLGRRYAFQAADLTDREQTRRVIPELHQKLGRIDILVNDAGMCPRAPVEEFPEEVWDTTLELNLSAAFVLCQAAGRIMLEQGRGKIINVASLLAFQGGMNIPSYAATKHGIAGLTKSLANAWAGRGVNVNAIAPGYFSTELTSALKNDPARYKIITGRTPAGRWGEPEELAGAAVFLASPAADFVHGAVLCVDGGWMAF